MVIQQLVRLAEETDTNPETRIATLQSERDRIDEQIEAIRQGRLQPLPDARALERVHEIIALAEDLASDFRRVRDRFEQLNRDLRERLMDNDASRGEVLQALFAGVDVIAQSDAGRTFSAFWRLLTNPEQSSALDQAIDEVVARDFAGQLENRDRRFLLRLTRMLLEQGGMVHEVLQHFARSLRHFVQSREYLEQRRFNQLLKDAQRVALSLKDEVQATGTLEYTLPLTSSRLRSLAQWVLFDSDVRLCPVAGGRTQAPLRLCLCGLPAGLSQRGTRADARRADSPWQDASRKERPFPHRRPQPVGARI